MNRRIICVALLPYICGISLAAFTGAEIVFVGLLAAAYLLYPAVISGQAREILGRSVIIILFFFLGFLNFRFRSDSIENKYAAFEKGGTLTEELTVTGKTGDGILYCGEAVVYYQDSGSIPIGSLISATGKVYPFEAAMNDGQFDTKKYHMSMGHTHGLYIKNDNDIRVLRESDFMFTEACYRVREDFLKGLGRVYNEGLSGENSGLILAMTVGEKDELSDEIYSLFKRTGIAHLLVVSGLHIGLIAAGIYSLARKRRGVNAGVIFGISAAVLYGALTGFGVSVVRAAVMFICHMIARIVGRGSDGIASISLAALVMLSVNPLLIYRTGFVLSFYLTGMILVMNDESRKEKTGGKAVVSAILMSVMSYPVLALYFNELSFAALGLNLVILPLMGFVMYTALLGGIAGMIFPVLGKLILAPVGWVLDLDIMLCRLFDDIPFVHVICPHPTLLRLFIYFGFLYVSFMYLKHMRRTASRIAAAALMLPACVFIMTGFHESGERIDMLDVGQGDGIYIRTEDGAQVFIDGGSSDVSGVGEYRILPFLKYRGTDRIDVWFISHFDADHISGFLELAGTEIDVGCVVTAKEVLMDQAFSEARDMLEERGIDVVYLSAGQSIRLGSGSFTCVGPSDGVKTNDRNGQSLALIYENGKGFEAFFGGDLGVNEENILIKEGRLKAVDMYKASHHGSDGSNSVEILKILEPKFAVISAGKNNRYDHPGKETIKRFDMCGIDHFCTIEGGQLTVIPGENNAAVKSFAGIVR